MNYTKSILKVYPAHFDNLLGIGWNIKIENINITHSWVSITMHSDIPDLNNLTRML